MTASFACATFHLDFVEQVAEKGAVPQLGKFAANFQHVCKCTSTIKTLVLIYFGFFGQKIIFCHFWPKKK